MSFVGFLLPTSSRHSTPPSSQTLPHSSLLLIHLVLLITPHPPPIMSRRTLITLRTVPVDCLLHIGTFLKSPSDSRLNDIDGITLAAILSEHDMLQHYMKRYNPSVITEKVALSGNLKALKFVIQEGCPMNERTCEAAAKSGNLKLLQWLRSKGCPWDEWTCHEAARSGNLEMLQWLHSARCPWDKRTCG